MSETTTEQAPETTEKKKQIVKLPIQTVSRNGVAKALTQFEILHGDNKDKPYLALQISPETLFDRTDDEGNVFKGDITMLSPVELCEFVNSQLKKQCQILWFDEDNINPETGEFMMSKFLASVADLQTGGMTLKDLRDKIDELTAESTLLSMDDSSMTEDGLSFLPEVTKRIRELSGSIRNYKSKMEKRSKKKDTQAEAAVKVS